MFDNLRDDANNSSFYYDDVEQQPQEQPAAESVYAASPAAPKKSARLLGMTAPQRFVIAVMLMMAVCSLGLMCLLVTGKMGM